MRKQQLKRIAKLYKKAYIRALMTPKASYIWGLLEKASGWKRPFDDVPF
jgi:hypothetical protein